METKSIFASKTFWGAVLAVAAPIAGQFGITLDEAGWSNDIVSLLGALIVIWGRVTATTKIKLV